MHGFARHSLLGVLGVSGAALALIRCGETPTSASPVAEVTTSTAPTGTSAACAVSPSETAGPYPSLTDLFRSDIREGKSGLPLTLPITVVNVSAGLPGGGAVGLKSVSWEAPKKNL